MADDRREVEENTQTIDIYREPYSYMSDKSFSILKDNYYRGGGALFREYRTLLKKFGWKKTRGSYTDFTRNLLQINCSDEFCDLEEEVFTLFNNFIEIGGKKFSISQYLTFGSDNPNSVKVLLCLIVSPISIVVTTIRSVKYFQYKKELKPLLQRLKTL